MRTSLAGKSTDIPGDALAPCTWSCSVSCSVPGWGLWKRRSVLPIGPCDFGMTSHVTWVVLMLVTCCRTWAHLAAAQCPRTRQVVLTFAWRDICSNVPATRSRPGLGTLVTVSCMWLLCARFLVKIIEDLLVAYLFCWERFRCHWHVLACH